MSKLEAGREKTGGRKAGTPNKMTKALKDMILGALDDVGGQAYLAAQAEANPKAFLALVGRVLPLQVASDPENPMPGGFTVMLVKGDHAG